MIGAIVGDVVGSIYGGGYARPKASITSRNSTGGSTRREATTCSGRSRCNGSPTELAMAASVSASPPREAARRMDSRCYKTSFCDKIRITAASTLGSRRHEDRRVSLAGQPGTPQGGSLERFGTCVATRGTLEAKGRPR